MSDFQKELAERIAAIPAGRQLCESAVAFMHALAMSKYSYNYSWQGLPIIEYPQDMVTMRELIWQIKPELIIEADVS
jgi:cephalosporin hydroxylase